MYRESVALTVYYGLLSGDPNGNFRSKHSLSRAEISVVMNNVIQKTEEEKLSRPVTPNGEVLVRHKPWTIEFVNFRRPDYNMVQKYPNYNSMQSFYGTVEAKVYSFDLPNLIVEHKTLNNTGDGYTVEKKTVYIFIYEKDLNLFTEGDRVIFNYDRNNEVTSYDFLLKK